MMGSLEYWQEYEDRMLLEEAGELEPMSGSDAQNPDIWMKYRMERERSAMEKEDREDPVEQIEIDVDALAKNFSYLRWMAHD